LKTGLSKYHIQTGKKKKKPKEKQHSKSLAVASA
jgi:hypothetical protein